MNRLLLLLLTFVPLLACLNSPNQTAPQSRQPADSFASLCDQAGRMTQASWERHFSDTLEKKQIRWTGQVSEVRQMNGQYFVWVNLGNGDRDARLQNVPEAKALALEPDQEIEFSGQLEFFGHSCKVDLIDVNIR